MKRQMNDKNIFKKTKQSVFFSSQSLMFKPHITL